ncbi:MAG TPA: BON domain-containing protein [Gemmatimonadaceae bacterium]|nr:BON domain-containing protein [Gemmatimonadaceae bacterium]
MSPLRFRDEESSSTGTVLGVLVGAVAGFAVGMLVAQRVGGFSGLKSKLRRRKGAPAVEPAADRYAVADDTEDTDEFEDIEDDELEAEEYDETLEERVLEAFRNDPILAERAVDIGSIGEGTIELAGWVENEDESHHAVTIARGVPGVETVVNRIAIGDEERRFEESARRVREGDASLTEAHWEGHSVGTGRRRQGTSDEADRHADPKVKLGERWQGTDDAIRNSADDTVGMAERRSRMKKSGRGEHLGSSSVSAGVPKGDHVVHPVDVEKASRVDTTLDAGSAQTERQDRI